MQGIMHSIIEGVFDAIVVVIVVGAAFAVVKEVINDLKDKGGD